MSKKADKVWRPSVAYAKEDRIPPKEAACSRICRLLHSYVKDTRRGHEDTRRERRGDYLQR